MNIKKIIALLLAVGCLSMTACNKTEESNDPSKGENTPTDMENNKNGGIKNSFIKLEGNEVVFRGKVTEVGEREIVMEIVDSEIAFGTYRVLINADTPYFDEKGEKITKSDIVAGDVIEVVFGGQVMQSYPPQISAKRVYLAE